MDQYSYKVQHYYKNGQWVKSVDGSKKTLSLPLRTGEGDFRINRFDPIPKNESGFWVLEEFDQLSDCFTIRSLNVKNALKDICYRIDL